MSLMEVSFGRFVCASQRIQLDIYLNLMEDSVGGLYEPHGEFIWRFV